jgi:Arc/MetJ-type ribon-helix-helix transcriptional regulator|tara:strand:- start:323 stop:472 length:150 start_codon:yes stop_codon:yes gene_type:complete
MKRKLSISVEAKTIDRLETFVDRGIFRNKSHFVEFAIDKFLEIKENERS